MPSNNAMPDDWIARLRALLQAATPEPWAALPPDELGHGHNVGAFSHRVWPGEPKSDFPGVFVADCAANPWSEADAALIATLRNLAPLLLDVVEASQKVGLPLWSHLDQALTALRAAVEKELPHA